MVEAHANKPRPKVFVSYSHDSAGHTERVLKLAERLRRDGLDCNVDEYETAPRGGWPRWAVRQIDWADFVLVVCTQTYLSRFEADDVEGGFGVKWEGAVITQKLYESGADSSKYVPVVFSRHDAAHIPTVLRGVPHYDVGDEAGYARLYRRLTGRPPVERPGLGDLRGTPAPAADDAAAPPDLELHFATQLRIIEEHADRFVGREYAERAFEEFKARQRRGYFVVRGGPGQGKTAYACRLAKAHGAVYHLISRTGARADTRLVLRSLVAQARRLVGADAPPPEGIHELARAWAEALSKAASARGPLVVVIDALDELTGEGGDGLPFVLTEALPEGVYVLVTSRPGTELEKLQEQLFDTPSEVYELGPLRLPEMRRIVLAALPDLPEAEVERVAEAAQGNPLYLRAAVEELARNPFFDLSELPQRIEGFFRLSTKGVRENTEGLLRDTLGVLAVARRPVSLLELSEIVGARQRNVYAQGILPVGQFLLELDDAYCFYHAGFHDFVTRELLFEDELRDYHRMVAEWLERPDRRGQEYRWSSLAYHLFSSGQRERLSEVIDERFLAEKVRRLGYAVLEDVELLARSMLDAGDPALVGRCVGIVEGLRGVAGGDLLDDAAAAVHPYRPGHASFRARLFEPAVPSVPGLDVYVGMLPKVEVPADFFEVVPLRGRLAVAIGDAPAAGLKSAFVARFVGNLFRKLVGAVERPHLGRLLGELNAVVSAHEYFRWVSMQCVELDPARGVLALANASHPHPVLYTARRGKCDRLPVGGELLNSARLPEAGPPRFEQRHAEIAPGDVLVLLTDGLTEGHLLMGDPYGYRFTAVVERLAGKGARAVGEAILDDWRAHHREGDYADDVTVVVIAVKEAGPRPAAEP